MTLKVRFAVLASALLTALFAQNWLTPLGASRAYSQLPKGRVGLGFASLLVAGVAAAVVLWRDRASDEDEPRDAVVTAHPPNRSLVYAGVMLVVLATGLAFFDLDSPFAVYPWAVGLAVFVAAFAFGEERIKIDVTFCFLFSTLVSLEPP